MVILRKVGKDNYTTVRAWRPIALLLYIGKGLERLIARRLGYAVVNSEILAPDDTGQPHALARRMGIMYVLWNDRSWASYRGFEPVPYLNSGCRTKKKCSKTLRHRDHVHISLTRKAANGKLSWYLAQQTD